MNVSEHCTELEDIWNAIFRGLAVIGRRDSHLLVTFYSEFQHWFATVQDFGVILRLTRSLSDSVSPPVKNNNNLSFALTNKVRFEFHASHFSPRERVARLITSSFCFMFSLVYP